MTQPIKDYLKAIGKRGGEATKKQHPQHFKEIGKKGAAKRWNTHPTPQKVQAS